jgi:hypothetical protein
VVAVDLWTTAGKTCIVELGHHVSCQRHSLASHLYLNVWCETYLFQSPRDLVMSRHGPDRYLTILDVLDIVYDYGVFI